MSRPGRTRRGATAGRAAAGGAARPRERVARRAEPFAWAPLAVAVMVLAVYAHTVGYGFHFDDFSNLRDNPALGPPLDLGALWAFRPSRVVLYLSFALQALVSGRSPAAFRVANLVLHAGAALLVGALARTLTLALGPRDDAARARASWTGLIAATLFAAHPLATQAVTYLIQRTASLAALFELGAVALYLRARASRRALDWALSWTLALLAAFTKEMAAALPLLVLALELVLRRRGRAEERADGWRVAVYAVVWPVLFVSSRLPTAKLPAGLQGLAETADIPRLTYGLTQLTVVPRYLALAVWPRGQNLDPDVALRGAPDGAVLLGALVLVALTAGAAMLARRRPLVLAGWLWCVLALLPESSVFPIRDVMVEHRMYLPLAGVAWIAAALLATLGRPAVRAAAAGALVLALALVAHARNRVWRDEVALWTDVTAKSPRLPRGWNDLGMALDEAGRPAEAGAAFERALALDPAYVYALVNLGRLEGMRGRVGESLALLGRAARLEPDAPDVLNDLGAATLAAGDSARADSLWARAVALAPGVAPPRENLARLRAARGAGAPPPR